MPSIQASLELFDNFSRRLTDVNQAMERSSQAAEELHNRLQNHITLRIDTGSALAQIEQLQQRMHGMSGSALNIVINGNDVLHQIAAIEQRIRSSFTGAVISVMLDPGAVLQQAQNIRRQLEAELGRIIIQLQIHMPQQLEAMFTNLQRLVLQLIRATRQLRAQSSNANQLAEALRRIEQLEERINQLQGQLNNRIRDGGHAAGGLLSNLQGILATYLSIQGLQSLLKSTVGGAMVQQQMVDTFSARAGSEELGAAIYNKIVEQALALKQDVNDALTGTMSFVSNTMDPTQLAQLNKLAMRLQKLNPFENLEGAAFSMKELLSGDYTSIVERFNIGRTTIKNSDALKAGKAGDIDGFIKGMDKLLNQQNMSEKAFEKMLDSPAAKWQGIINRFKYSLAEAGQGGLKAFEPLFDKLEKAFESGKLDSFFRTLQAGLTIFASMMSSAVDGALKFWDIMKSNPEIATAAMVASGLILIGLLWAMVAPVVAQAIAWAAAYWPVYLIAIAIGIVVAALLYLGVTGQQIVGSVVGYFYFLYATIYNIIADVWNLFAVLAEFLVNLFIDPVYAIKKLFYDLNMMFLGNMANMLTAAESFAGGFMKVVLEGVNGIIKGLNWMVEAMNKLPGVDIPTAKLFDVDNVHAMSDGIKSMMSKLEAPTSDKNVYRAARMQQMDLASSFSKGYKVGEGMFNKLEDTARKIDGFGKDQKGDGKLPNIDKVGTVGSIGDTVDISSEDLKVMRDLAEMKAIQNFVTLTPTVHVTTGPVTKDVDVDEVIEKIVHKSTSEIESSAQGLFV